MAHNLLAVAILIPIGTLIGYIILEILIHYVMGFLSGSSALDDLMIGHAYLIISFLIGSILTVLYRQKVAELIYRNGLPFIMSGSEDEDNNDSPKNIPHVSVVLFVKVEDKRSKEGRIVFSGNFGIERLRETIHRKAKPKVVLSAKNGVKLVIARAAHYSQSSDIDPDTLFVKLIRKGKVVFHLETIAFEDGQYSSNAETGNAACTYKLVHISCSDSFPVATLQFFGKTKEMRKLFFA